MKEAKMISGLISRYLKTIVSSIILALYIGFIAPFLLAVSKLNRIKVGEYPDMPRELIDKQYQEALPTVIIESMVMFLLISILVFIPALFIRFKQINDINLYQEIKQYVRKR